MTMPGDVLFDFDKDVFKKDKDTIDAITHIRDIIKASNPRRVEVHGHTDNIGSGLYNWDLSNRRAEHTAQWLVKAGCVAVQQVLTIGHGAMKPVATNRTSEGRAFNRRIEVKIEKWP